MAFLAMLFGMLLQAAVYLVLLVVVYRVVGSIAALFSQGVWHSPIEDDRTIWAWLRDQYEDKLEPASWAARRIENRRARGECIVCGYSLRGNTSGTCPECGTSTEYGSTTGVPTVRVRD